MEKTWVVLKTWINDILPLSHLRPISCQHEPQPPAHAYLVILPVGSVNAMGKLDVFTVKASVSKLVTSVCNNSFYSANSCLCIFLCQCTQGGGLKGKPWGSSNTNSLRKREQGWPRVVAVARKEFLADEDLLLFLNQLQGREFLKLIPRRRS